MLTLQPTRRKRMNHEVRVPVPARYGTVKNKSLRPSRRVSYCSLFLDPVSTKMIPYGTVREREQRHRQNPRTTATFD